ncbi:DUF1501 domain-containing protein [Calycomorphotria hydatis]|uniref:DUF1501 domain-containing protein n=1 Tax=Calycomorphotria hydatis TaxID=2528027 RepID=A0A517T6M4_9PLAN|nr:DUF1501 domain-containing protein [Calycomorphotria hydatis]QDT64018.1 hypothetical protein V22_12480 [Calycomorphotria hydatis]
MSKSLLLPNGMTRRHFMGHLATAAATVPTMEFIQHVKANAAEVRRNQKACVLVWLGGGAPTIDMWDLKPGSKNGGEFRPISTAGDLQISEHLPEIAKVMDKLSVVRSMSTREADHTRGRYYMHTSFVPNPTVVHPVFGSVVSYELGSKRKDLEIPGFISIGGGAGSPGFLGMSHAPFSVDGNGRIRNAQMAGFDERRLKNRLAMLDIVETNFIKSNRGESPAAHRDVYEKAVDLMTSSQMEAFKIDDEPEEMREMYGANNLGRGLLMARRLIEVGVPFIEVNMGGWDLHQDVFNRLSNERLPVLDQAIASLTRDLTERGMIDDVVIVCMGEFGRTPRINQDVGRDHFARAWSLMIGGGGLNGGIAVGETNADGDRVEGKSYLPGDVWATVAHALGIPLDTVHTSKLGRPMRLANGGRPISELIA